MRFIRSWPWSVANSTPRGVLFYLPRIDGMAEALLTFISTAATSVVR